MNKIELKLELEYGSDLANRIFSLLSENGQTIPEAVKKRTRATKTAMTTGPSTAAAETAAAETAAAETAAAETAAAETAAAETAAAETAEPVLLRQAMFSEIQMLVTSTTPAQTAVIKTELTRLGVNRISELDDEGMKHMIEFIKAL